MSMVRLRRSELSTPASNVRMLQKAAASQADLVMLDLEDSVSPADKEKARGQAIEALRSLDWGNKTRAVRINDLESEYAYRDIVTLVEEAGEHLDILIVPKVKRARDVWWVDRLLTQIEKRCKLTRPLGLEVLIEETEALINVEKIARASERLEALIFGPADYAASQGIDLRYIGNDLDAYPGDLWHYARNKIVVAARAAGIEAIDGPYIDIRNLDGYRRECLRASVLGFSGKWAIHPEQIPIANEVFAPAPEQVAQARRLVALYEEAQRHGQGAIEVEGRMIDVAVIRNARQLIARADLLGI
ncbi:MAG: CoA ester lyase [Thermogemmatispora sp.]|uniref:HpcH/HpaI aldolase/citrate lyase family protein n=1 Tax=Thermogemmatispora sp. TaxID=1968838 RepID=UPI00261F46C0|nr:CoA ester lyase [Thermogemmatispora sp.]MBX5457503.1 CoA ester lyase [Thermogemmatispora sp.]